MFQIVSTLMEEVPVFALRMMELRGKQPHMQFVNDPWGHDEKMCGGMRLPGVGLNRRFCPLSNSPSTPNKSNTR